MHGPPKLLCLVCIGVKMSGGGGLLGLAVQKKAVPLLSA